MDYRLELLSEDDFERLVNKICQKILGTGVITFAKGQDGGRDGRFTGKAERFPSTEDAWSGKFIIQAKHTSNPVATCSNSEFVSILNGEIEKIKILKRNNEIDCYLLFTNRKYTGVKGEELRNEIIIDTGLEKVEIIGKETINDQYLNSNRDLVSEFKLNLLHIPFDFSEYEIKNIIGELKNSLGEISLDIKQEVEKIKTDYERIGLDEKNKKNAMSKEYYENEILSSSLQNFEKISSFLSDPRNEDLKDQFFDTATELRNLILLKRDNFLAFEEIFIFIYKKICDGKEDIKGKRHIFTLLHFMYCECYIGLK